MCPDIIYQILDHLLTNNKSSTYAFGPIISLLHLVDLHRFEKEITYYINRPTIHS